MPSKTHLTPTTTLWVQHWTFCSWMHQHWSATSQRCCQLADDIWHITHTIKTTATTAPDQQQQQQQQQHPPGQWDVHVQHTNSHERPQDFFQGRAYIFPPLPYPFPLSPSLAPSFPSSQRVWEIAVSSPSGSGHQTQWRIYTLKNTFGDDLLAMNWRFFVTKKNFSTFPGEGKCSPAHACGRPC